MPTPFLGELRIIAFNFAPQGWAFCNGQLIPINQNQALFSLIGTTYGGNGQTNFALPDMRAKTPMHTDNIDFLPGQTGGEQTHALTLAELGMHGHKALGAGAGGGNLASPANGYWADWGKSNYAETANAAMAGTVTPVGGNQAHENMPPYLVLNFIIALQGAFPTQ